MKSIVDRLRAPDGCPWDREQTPASLKPFLLEEAHEVAEAIESGDPRQLCEELGDLLMNIFLQARIAEEESRFSLAEIAEGIADKLVRRHPHVFADGTAKTSAEVRTRWEEIKAREKGAAHTPESALRKLPASLPALAQADRLGRMAADIGFDWDNVEGAFGKVEEELGELRAALPGRDPVRIEEEVGDLLFAVSSVARHLKIDPEAALRQSLARFRRRFAHLESALPGETSRDSATLDRLWRAAKHAEAAPHPDNAPRG